MAAFSLCATVETWPLKDPFVIARGAKTEANVVTVSIADGTVTGRGECVPYARYEETVDSVLGAIETARERGYTEDRAALQTMPAGAARNAIDCALWDLEAKRNGLDVFALTGRRCLPQALETCFTLSLASPEAMAQAARTVPHLRLLKLKLGGEGDDARMKAVRHARPDARLVADANEAWTPAMLQPYLVDALEAGIELIEQPLPANIDEALAATPHLVPICADESAHTSADIPRLSSRYDAVNIKLDKAGGLTEALVMADAARKAGLRVMVGSMVATSLALAPAFYLAQGADWVDLDGPLLLAKDRVPGFTIENGFVSPPPSALWG